MVHGKSRAMHYQYALPCGEIVFQRILIVCSKVNWALVNLKIKPVVENVICPTPMSEAGAIPK